MKLFVSVFACLAALVASSSLRQRQLEHSLDVAQGPLLDAMFDYQNRGYHHFTMALTPHLNEIKALRSKIHDLTAEEVEAHGNSTEEEIHDLVHKLPQIIKNPAPNELIKSRALFLAQIDLTEHADGHNPGRSKNLIQRVKEIVVDEGLIASSSSSVAADLQKRLSKKYEELSEEIHNQKIPTIEEIEFFVPFTQKHIDSLKYSPDSIDEALIYTDVLNTYKMKSYLVAKQLPINSIEKVDKYSEDIGDFYKTLYSVYQFDGGH